MAPPHLLADFEGPAAELINPDGNANIVLICEHAANFIPASLNGLGLQKEALESHAAWDIGARELAITMSEMLDAPLIASRVSRLVYDCNRAPESGRGMPSKSELIEVPGNQNLSDAQIQSRLNEVYAPFHQRIHEVIEKKSTAPAIITVHSFTPVYFGEVREVELGILHDSDDRLAKPVMAAVQSLNKYQVEFNSPYGVDDDVMHTINKHAEKDNLLNVMFEVKNDLLSSSSQIKHIANDLSYSLEAALAKLTSP